jgi:hypothetical protein
MAAQQRRLAIRESPGAAIGELAVRRHSRIEIMAEMTCPKCGKQYYGVGCPYCDYPPVPPDKQAARTSLLMGFVLLALGIYIAMRFVFDRTWRGLPVLDAGVLFALGGFQLVGVQLLYNEKGRISTLVGGLILAAFAYLCFYGAFSQDAHWSSIPFIPQSWSQMLARTISGLIGVMCVAFTLRSLYLLVKPKHKNDHAA